MKLVDDWKKAWKWLSVQLPALNLAFLGTWALLPEKFQEALPMPWVIGIAVALIVCGIAGRLVKQK